MTISRDDRVLRNRVPPRRVNGREQPGGRPHYDYTPSPPPRRRANSTVVPFLKHLSLILYHSLGLFSTLLRFLIVPLAVAGSAILALYMYQYVAEVAIQTTCSLPGASYLPMCTIPPPPVVPPLFAKAIKQEYAVAYMQKIASDNSALPYTLLSEQTSIKDIIFQISAADLPSKAKLLPKVNRYNTLLEQVVDGIQDAQIKTDTLVDNTISTYNWAEDQLEQIHSQRSSLMAPLRVLASNIGLSSTLSNEQAVQEIFYGYTDRLQEDAGAVVIQYLKTRGYIIKFRDLLNTLAMDFKQEGDILEDRKLGDASYWKWLLRSHRQKMSGYDQKMELCAKFYTHLMQGEKVIAVTLFKMQEMRGRVGALRDELRKAPLLLDGQTKPALKLTIDAIKSAVGYLEESKTISHKQREQRMLEFEKTMS